MTRSPASVKVTALVVVDGVPVPVICIPTTMPVVLVIVTVTLPAVVVPVNATGVIAPQLLDISRTNSAEKAEPSLSIMSCSAV